MDSTSTIDQTPTGWARAALAVFRLTLFFLILYTASFVLFDIGPDAAFRQLGWQAVDVHALEVRRDQLGLDGPWYHRYAKRLSNLIKGDLGTSMNGGWEVAPVFWERTKVSAGIWLAAISLVLTVPLPLALGFCSWSRIPVTHRLLRAAAPFGLAPQFLTAALAYVLWKAHVVHRVPTGSRELLEWTAVVLAAGAFPVAMVFLAASNSARTIAQQQFVTVYLAKGLSWPQIRWWVIRNIWIECRVIVWRAILATLIGSVFGEFLFGIDGLGRLFLEALRARDLPVIEPWALLIGSLTFVIVTQERRGRWN